MEMFIATVLCVMVCEQLVIIGLIITLIIAVKSANKSAVDIACKAITRVELVKSLIEDAVKGSVERFQKLEEKVTAEKK